MSRYANRIKVVGADLMCFPVDKDTLGALACSCYDPWAWSDPDRDAAETITVGEWNARRDARRATPETRTGEGRE